MRSQWPWNGTVPEEVQKVQDLMHRYIWTDAVGSTLVDELGKAGLTHDELTSVCTKMDQKLGERPKDVLFEELEHLQAWLKKYGGFYMHKDQASEWKYDEATQVYHKYTGVGWDGRFDKSHLVKGPFILRAAEVHTYNKETGVGRNLVSKAWQSFRASDLELAHWDATGSATMSNRRARMYQI